MNVEDLPRTPFVSIVECNDFFLTVKFNVDRAMIQNRQFNRSLNALKNKLNYPWMNVGKPAKFGNTKLNVSALKTFIEAIESISTDAK
ncbi:TPA: hypothetical protein NID02_001606 [Pseudomonas aeruginosa]|nr:hypothetical protein [Pseudomonas aeruginosa]